MKEHKRAKGATPGDGHPQERQTDRSSPADQVAKAGDADVHSGQGSSSALEKLRKQERQRARSRAADDRPGA